MVAGLRRTAVAVTGERTAAAVRSRRIGTGAVAADLVVVPQRSAVSALVDIARPPARQTAGRIIVEAQFSCPADTSMPGAAQQTITTARALYGEAAANTVRSASAARGLA